MKRFTIVTATAAGVFAAEQRQEIFQVGRFLEAVHIQVLDVEVHQETPIGLQRGPQLVVLLLVGLL